MTMSGRICILRHGYYPMDVRVRRETNVLLAAGFDVDIVCLQLPGQPLKEEVGGATVYRLPLRHHRGGRLRYIAQYAASILLCALVASALHAWRRYDVVQINTMPDLMAFAALIPKLFGARTVLDMHDPMPELYMAKFGATASNLLARLLVLQEGASMRLADRIITVVDEVRSILVRRHHRDDIAVIMNCPDETLLPRWTSNSTAGRSGDDRNDRFVLISHGAVVERLGYDTAIQAMAILQEAVPGIELQIVGSGEYTEDLKRLAERLGVAGRVRFVGYVPQDQIPDLVANADVGVVANKRDGFADLCLPTKLLEYVWMGKPTVVARTPTIANYFDDDMVAYFTPGRADELADRILWLYQRPERRRTLVSNASRFFDRRSWVTEGIRYRDLLLDLLEESCGPRRDANTAQEDHAPRTVGASQGSCSYEGSLASSNFPHKEAPSNRTE